MIFTNTAELSYSGGTTVSNSVSGDLLSAFSFTKESSVSTYTADTVMQYAVTVINRSNTTFTGLTVYDDFGIYFINSLPRFPLAYTYDTARLSYYSGSEVSSGTVTVNIDTDGVTFGFDLPANTTAILTYEVYITPFAPLSAGSAITNTATLNGSSPLLPISAENTITAEQSADLVISKTSQGTAQVGQPFTFVFTVANYGNTPTQPDNYLTISDQLNPSLTNISVYANNILWTEGTEYMYSESLFYFQTADGAVQLPAAVFTQDSFGIWNTTPSSLTITITGTVSSAQPSQALTEIVPAYADGRENSLSVVREQNDLYTLLSDGTVPPVYSIMLLPIVAISLTDDSDSHFSLSGNLLSVDTTGIASTISAGIIADYGDGFTINVNYIP